MNLRCDECEWETPKTRPEEEVLADHGFTFGVKCTGVDRDAKTVTMENLHVPGAKDDGGKLPVELVPVEAIEAMAEVLAFGREKYTEDGWKSVPQAFRRYMAANLRHAYAILRGEVIDPESGLPHVYHMHCNTGFMCYFHKRGIACRVFEVELEK
jgi:hypothetical protein